MSTRDAGLSKSTAASLALPVANAENIASACLSSYHSKLVGMLLFVINFHCWVTAAEAEIERRGIDRVCTSRALHDFGQASLSLSQPQDSPAEAVRHLHFNPVYSEAGLLRQLPSQASRGSSRNSKTAGQENKATKPPGNFVLKPNTKTTSYCKQLVHQKISCTLSMGSDALSASTRLRHHVFVTNVYIA